MKTSRCQLGRRTVKLSTMGRNKIETIEVVIVSLDPSLFLYNGNHRACQGFSLWLSLYRFTTRCNSKWRWMMCVRWIYQGRSISQARPRSRYTPVYMPFDILGPTPGWWYTDILQYNAQYTQQQQQQQQYHSICGVLCSVIQIYSSIVRRV